MYVELKNINKTYGDYKASDNVSFGIEKGKGIMGSVCNIACFYCASDLR